MYQIWCKSKNVKWVKIGRFCMGQRQMDGWTDRQKDRVKTIYTPVRESRVYKNGGLSGID